MATEPLDQRSPASGRDTGERYALFVDKINQANKLRRVNRLRKFISWALLGFSPLFISACNDQTDVPVSGIAPISTLPDAGTKPPTNKMARPAQEDNPTPIPTLVISPSTEFSETASQEIAPGHSLALKNPDGNLEFVTVEDVQGSTVTYLDSYHNTNTITLDQMRAGAISEIAPGLTVENADRAINQYLRFDDSIPKDRQLQIKALTFQFLATFSTIFPKDSQGLINLDDVFSFGVTVKLNLNPKTSGGYNYKTKEILVRLDNLPSGLVVCQVLCNFAEPSIRRR